MKRKNVVLSLLGVLLFGLLCALAATVSSPNFALLVQREINIPGKIFRVGSASFQVQHQWLLLASKTTGQDNLRMYGFLPILGGREIAAPYFSFSDLSRKGGVKFSYSEVPRSFNARLKAWLNAPLVSRPDLKDCVVINKLVLNYPAIQCLIEGGQIIYLPAIGVQLQLYSREQDVRSYFRILKN
jgi:hypothetical protein